MVEFRVTHKHLKKPNDTVKALKDVVSQIPGLAGLSVKVVTNGNPFGQAFLRVDYDLDETDGTDLQLFLKATNLLVRNLKNSDDVKSVELLAKYPEFNNEAEAFLYNYGTGRIPQLNGVNDGYVKL